MRRNPDVEPVLRDFILGRLQPEPRLEFEHRLVTDPATFDALGIAEEDLTEDYLDGALSRAERQDFERHFITSRGRRREIEFLRLLKAQARMAARGRERAREARAWWRMGDLVRLSPAWSGAVAAVLVVLVGGNLWLAVQRSRLQGQIESLSARNTDLQSRLDSPKATPVERPLIPSFGLAPSLLLRGEGSVRQITVSKDADAVRLQLEIPSDEYPSYRASLYDPDNAKVLEQSKLRAQAAEGRTILTVVVPAQMLSSGTYRMELSGATARGGMEAIAAYAFRVTTH